MRYKILIITLILTSSIYAQHINSGEWDSVRDYFDKNGVEYIEGEWEYALSNGSGSRVLIIKGEHILGNYGYPQGHPIDYKYYVKINGNTDGNFTDGDLKAILEPAAVDEILSINWKISKKSSMSEDEYVYKLIASGKYSSAQMTQETLKFRKKNIDKETSTVGTLSNNNSLIEFSIEGNKVVLYRIYPKLKK